MESTHSDPRKIKCISYSPSRDTRLGDVGYVDGSGNWQRVVNIVDGTSCQNLGMKPIPLTKKVGDYITKDKPLSCQQKPYVKIFGAGSWHTIEQIQMAETAHRNKSWPDGVKPVPGKEQQTSENLSTDMKIWHTQIMLNPAPNKTSISFIAGPEIYIRYLHLPNSTVTAWLKKYRRQIARAARSTMKRYPPNERLASLCISLTEYFTQNWRTLFVRTTTKPSKFVLAYNSETNNGAGRWVVLEPMDNNNSTINAGEASLAVPSKP